MYVFPELLIVVGPKIRVAPLLTKILAFVNEAAPSKVVVPDLISKIACAAL